MRKDFSIPRPSSSASDLTNNNIDPPYYLSDSLITFFTRNAAANIPSDVPDEFAPSYLLHRMTRVQRLPHAAAHPFQSVSAERFAPPVLPNQAVDDAEENQGLRSIASLQPALNWGAAVRAAPLLPPHLGRMSGKSRPIVNSKKALVSESSMSEGLQARPPRMTSLYATLPAVDDLSDPEVIGRRAASAHASVPDNCAAPQASVKNITPGNEFQASEKIAPEACQIADDFENGTMAAWVSLRKAFDAGSIAWDLHLPLYSQELIDDFTTENFKQKRPGVVADLRARAVQRKANVAIKSAQAAMSDEELMAQKEKLELSRRNKLAMDLRLGRLIAEDEGNKAGSTKVLSAAPGKTGTKTNLELEIEAFELRAVQIAREKRLEAALASSSRLRAVGHVNDNIGSDCSMTQVELRLEAFRSYKLSIPSFDAHCDLIQKALKRTFYFSACSNQEQDFFVYALQNCSVKEPYSVDVSGCSLSETAGSGFGLMMSTPMNQLTALHARHLLVSSSSWRFMCDGIRMSRSLAVLDISFARGAPQSAEGMKYFSSALNKNVSLIELIAQGLPLNVPEHAASLAEAISTHVRIKKIDFSDCSISDFCMNALCDSFGKNSMQLHEIRLSGNSFAPLSVTLLLRAICTSTSAVHTLICNRTNLDAVYEYPVSLLRDIRVARQMRHVQMDDCFLGCKGGLVLLNMLLQLPCVRTLSFQRNNIDDSSGLKSLFWLKPLSHALCLERLSLTKNLLHDEAALFIIKVIKSGNVKRAKIAETVNDLDAIDVDWGQGAPMLRTKYLSKKHEDFVNERAQLRMLDFKRMSSSVYGSASQIAKRVWERADRFFSRFMHQAQASLALKLNDELQCLFLIRRYPNDIELSLLNWSSLLVNPNLSSFFPELIDAATAARYEEFGREYRKERLKRVIELKEIHYESRELQKKARANMYEIDPNAILPELSDSPFWDSSGDEELERIQQLKSKSSASFQEQAAMLESQAKFEAERLSQQIFTISGFIQYLEGLVKHRIEKKERRKQARLAYKANEKQRKLEDVRIREEERFQRRKGLSVIQKPVKRQEAVQGDNRQESAPGNVTEEEDSKKQEVPIYPQNIHGGSVSADKLIRSKMVPGDSIGQILGLIESLTPQFHQDLIDGESSDKQPSEIADAARKKYGSIVQERISDEVKGRYVLAGHVQQLVQKLQRSPFYGIIVPVCASLQSKAVNRETYERDVAPFMNSTQRKDFAVFMKRFRDSQALHAATVEQARKNLQGQKSLLVHYCRQKRIKETGYLSQRELFDILLSAKVSTIEAKALILALDPLVDLDL